MNQKAIALRRNQTDAELRLWMRLRSRQLSGYRFRRQHPVGPYVVDFICIEAGLVVEVDGGQHSLDKERDQLRTEYLERAGFRVVRFWNNDVLLNTANVLEEITRELRPSP